MNRPVDKRTEIKSTLTIRGPRADRIRLLREVIGLGTDADILNHLIQRGMSAEASTVAAWQMARTAQEIMHVQFTQMGEQLTMMIEQGEPMTGPIKKG